MPRFGSDSGELVGKLALSKLSEDLFSSPALRAEFTADPTKYFASRFGARLGEKDLEFVSSLQDMVAGGLCCGGCGCRPEGFTDVLVSRALRQGF